MGLSKRRAQSVYDALTGKYGISGDRLTIQAEGSDVQPYSENDISQIVAGIVCLIVAAAECYGEATVYSKRRLPTPKW